MPRWALHSLAFLLYAEPVALAQDGEATLTRDLQDRGPRRATAGQPGDEVDLPGREQRERGDSGSGGVRDSAPTVDLERLADLADASPFCSLAPTSGVRLTEETKHIPTGRTATSPTSGESMTINPRSWSIW